MTINFYERYFLNSYYILVFRLTFLSFLRSLSFAFENILTLCLSESIHIELLLHSFLSPLDFLYRLQGRYSLDCRLFCKGLLFAECWFFLDRWWLLLKGRLLCHHRWNVILQVLNRRSSNRRLLFQRRLSESHLLRNFLLWLHRLRL